VVCTNTTDLWDATPRNLVEIYRLYEQTYCHILPEAAHYAIFHKNLSLNSKTLPQAPSSQTKDKVSQPLQQVQQFFGQISFNATLTY
jgi:hypothetical protein